MLKINEWKLFDEIDFGEIPTDLGIYEFWIESDSEINGKHYYGKAKNLRVRFRQGYFNRFKDPENPRCHNVLFNTSIKKHGTRNLYYRIREIISYDSYIINPSKNDLKLKNLEIDYIRAAEDIGEYLFNQTSGGDGSSGWYDSLSDEDKLKFSLKRAKPVTSTGIFHVIKLQHSPSKKLYFWRYQDNNGLVIGRSSLRELKAEVEAQGLEWIVLDEEKAMKSFQEDEELEKNLYKGNITNTSGILNVHKRNDINMKKGFNWVYRVRPLGVSISRVSLRELMAEVEAQGFDWIILDEEKAMKSFQEDEELEKNLYKGRKNNTSGILNVNKAPDRTKKGYRWVFTKYSGVNISRVSLRELKKEVEAQGFDWIVLDEEKAMKSFLEDEELEKRLHKGLKTNTSGILNVHKHKVSNAKKGFNWVYKSKKIGVKFTRSSLRELKKEVETRDLDWIILDKEKAMKSFLEDEELEKNLYKGRKSNTTGILYIYKVKSKTSKKGFNWMYFYPKTKKRIIRVSLSELKAEVEAQGFDWIVLDEEKALKSFQEDEELEKNLSKGRKDNNSGILYVSKCKNDSYKKKYIWYYQGKKHIRRVSLKKLKAEVEAQGFDWIVLDEEKAMKSFQEDEELEKNIK